MTPVKIRGEHVHRDTPRPKGQIPETKSVMVQRETFAKNNPVEGERRTLEEHRARFNRKTAVDRELEGYFSKLSINRK